MKYFIDTEFLEGKQDKTILGFKYGETKPTIDLISIGIVAEDDREYYAISKDFNLKEAWNRWQQRTGEGDRNNIEPRLYWLRENVLKPIMVELQVRYNKETGQTKNGWQFKDFKYLINKYGKTNKQIAEEIKVFTQFEFYKVNNKLQSNKVILATIKNNKYNPEFYAYYADYDWVAFCWLFGKMIDLPTGFPMYCIDLKQMLDSMYMMQENKYKGINRINAWLQDVKKHPNYPKQTNEHNALDDAIFNKNLYNFLKQF